MKYLCYFSWEPNTQQQTEAIRRFKETGGQPPAGVRLLGRWIRADFMGGVVLLESDDAKALTAFGLMWSDVMTLQIVPVIEDEDLVEVLGAGAAQEILVPPRRPAYPNYHRQPNPAAKHHVVGGS